MKHQQFVLVVALFTLSITPAYAYLNPATGTMLIQSLIGSISAGICFIIAYYQQIKLFLKSKFRSKQEISQETIIIKNPEKDI